MIKAYSGQNNNTVIVFKFSTLVVGGLASCLFRTIIVPMGHATLVGSMLNSRAIIPDIFIIFRRVSYSDVHVCRRADTEPMYFIVNNVYSLFLKTIVYRFCFVC